MARFIKGIHGSYQGKVGSIVGSSWRGIDYVRSLPKKSSKAASEDQIAQRMKFGMTTSFLKSIKDVLMLGFSDSKQRNKTGYNVAFKQFINNAFVGSYPNFTIDYAAVKIASGGLASLVGLQAVEAFPKVLSLTWDPIGNRFNAFDDDQVLVILYDQVDNLFFAYEGATRLDATMEITLPDSYTGKTIVGWTFNIHRDGVITSSSQYLGEFVLT
ncbi:MULTISPECIES: DUF6266 family protein [Sphingobacterium]|uniref:DUF6266 family protein n=1 Tax=Sphingobacterium TaxID=28453 RepID=UPI00257E8343|nr:MULTISPECIES: DUF6266 family protein [Sphingobacterium]